MAHFSGRGGVLLCLCKMHQNPYDTSLKFRDHGRPSTRIAEKTTELDSGLR